MDDLQMLTDEAWRSWLLRDYDSAWAALSTLHDEDPQRFLAVSRVLARDLDSHIARAGLRQLGFRGERVDAEGDEIARTQLRSTSHEVHDAALLALGRVGLPSVFPLLEAQISPNSHFALLALAAQARTAQQRTRVLALARRLVLAENARVRIAAVRIVCGFSSVPEEEDLLLEAADRYLDEVTCSNLRHATPRALPRLKQIQARLRVGSAQWHGVTRAIEAIEIRT